MNSLMTADREIKAIENRRSTLATDAGRRKAEQYMIGQYEYLRMCGYRIPETDYKVMAKVWVDQLSDYIVTYGFRVITEAVRRYVRMDCDSFRQMPNPANIIKLCKEVGHNPIAEAKRRELDDIADKMRKEVDDRAREELDDKKREDFFRRYPNIAAVIERGVCGD